MGLTVKLVPQENYVQVLHFLNIVYAINILYEVSAAIDIADPERETLEASIQRVRTDKPLRITHITSGSPITIDVSGIEKALDGVRKCITEFRDWGEHKAQEREDTRSKQLDNLAKALAIADQYSKLTPEGQEIARRLLSQAVEIIGNTPVKVLPPGRDDEPTNSTK